MPPGNHRSPSRRLTDRSLIRAAAFAATAEANEDDMVVSPLLIGLAFGMADVGTTGDTAAALEGLFGLPASGEQRWAAFNALDLAVGDVGAPTVRLANREFPDVGFRTEPGYDETLAEHFAVAGAAPAAIGARSLPPADRCRAVRRTRHGPPRLTAVSPSAARGGPGR